MVRNVNDRVYYIPKVPKELLKTIYIGQKFTTKNKLLTTLGFPKVCGSTRESCITEVNRYLAYEKTGKLYRGNPTNEIIITKIYEEPMERKDGRRVSRKDKSLSIKKFNIVQFNSPKVYKYVHKTTKEVDYVGILWSHKRKLSRRITEHSRNDNMDLSIYDVFYFNVTTKADAEIWEGHLISHYKTHNKLNKYKSKWGLCTFLKGKEDEINWIKYEVITK